MSEVLTVGPAGLQCPAGECHLDPVRPVARALISHGHMDHARAGHGAYWCTSDTARILRSRLGASLPVTAVAEGEPFTMGDSEITFLPAGHVLGSAQIRVCTADGTWIYGGDYKRESDPTCKPFALASCDTFITESTFALPVYRWPDSAAVADELVQWWNDCREQGRAAVLFAYAFGKTQRLLALLQQRVPQRMAWLHTALRDCTDDYREAGCDLLPTELVSAAPAGQDWRGELILAPPSASGSPWMKRFGKRPATAAASGWMTARGRRRRSGYERGFVLSDHADWDGILRTVRETGARRVLCTHGFSSQLARHLREQGLAADVLEDLWQDLEAEDD